MKNSTVWLWVLSWLSGCLPGNAVLEEKNAELSVLRLEVRDSNHGVWPTDGIARAPRFALEIDGDAKNLDQRIFLLDGRLDADLEADLLDPPVREGTRGRLLPITIEHQGDWVMVSPQERLAPGRDLTLLVVETREALWQQPLRVSPLPMAGAELVESLPATHTRRVPINMQSIWLRFDGYLTAEGLEASLHVLGSTTLLEQRLQPCAELALPVGDCLELVLSADLPPKAAVSVHVTGLLDSTGAPLSDTTLSFETGDSVDDAPPQTEPTACALDERVIPGVGCALEQDDRVRLRLLVDEPGVATLRTEHQSRSAFSFGADLELSLTALDPGMSMPTTLLLRDLAGHARTLPLLLSTHAKLAHLSIDEVRCDPLGPEPDQESIELLNFGREALEIQGFRVSDDPSAKGLAIVDALQVAPGERVLVVGPDFDPRDLTDGMLSPGVRIARTDKPLSLGNEGEALFLRDPEGRRVSAAPREKPSREGACIARSSTDRRGAASGTFRSDPNATCTPGAETIWP